MSIPYLFFYLKCQRAVKYLVSGPKPSNQTHHNHYNPPSQKLTQVSHPNPGNHAVTVTTSSSGICFWSSFWKHYEYDYDTSVTIPFATLSDCPIPNHIGDEPTGLLHELLYVLRSAVQVFGGPPPAHSQGKRQPRQTNPFHSEGHLGVWVYGHTGVWDTGNGHAANITIDGGRNIFSVPR